MGVEIPMISINRGHNAELHYGLYSTNAQMDETRVKFTKVKMLTADLAEIENSVYRLANAIKKTQKRANALKNIMIPRFEDDVKFITAALEEKEREEFARLKVIKKNKAG
jgi:V/A-type H+-transporting ATPase subunit D